MKKEFPGGVWPVMLTPFTDENKVDYESLGTGILKMGQQDFLQIVSLVRCFFFH